MDSVLDECEVSSDKYSDMGFVDDDVQSLNSVSIYETLLKNEANEKRPIIVHQGQKCSGVSNQKHKAIVNDVTRNQIERDRLSLNDYRLDLSSLPRSVSFESITSGISVGTSASEERKGILKHVSSYSSLSSKDVNTEHLQHQAVRPISEYSRNRRKTIPFDSPTTEKTRRCKSASVSASQRKVSFQNNQSDESRKHSSSSGLSSQKHRLQRSMSVSNYDPALEKSQTFLHGQNKNFSRTNQYLTPARPGLQKLQINYTQTNTENNHLVIFADLVKTSHRRNYVINESVDKLERRLLIRRNDPNRATSYFVNMKIKDPIRKAKQKALRTVAEKQKQRQERIKKTTEELKLGYIPTSQTIKPVGEQDMELIRKCRYLRIDSKLQEY